MTTQFPTNAAQWHLAEEGQTPFAGVPFVREVNDLAALASFRLVWKSLLLETPGASFFHSLEWLESYWRHFGADQQLRVLIVEAAGRVIGIVPLVVRREKTRVGLVRVLTYPLHGWGSFYSPVGPNPTASLLAAFRYLQQVPQDWDLIDLRWVDMDGLDASRTSRTMDQVGWAPHTQPWMQSMQIEIDQGWGPYWGSRKTKWRSNVRRFQKRLTSEGHLEFVRHRPLGIAQGDDEPRWDLYDTCEEIARCSWQGSSHTGTTLSHPQVRDFLRDAHIAAARSGALDMALMKIDGRPVAFSYNYHLQGYLYGLRVGYDPSMASDGVGNVLQCWIIEDSCQRGDRLIDLGPGSQGYKRHWQTRVQTCYRHAYYQPRSLKAQLLRVKHWLTSRWSADPTVYKAHEDVKAMA